MTTSPPLDLQEDLLLELIWLHYRQCSLRLRGFPSQHSPAKPTDALLRLLTKREQEVLQRIAHGDTDLAAGRALGIAARTVGKHMEHILGKLGLSNRTSAVVAFYDPGLWKVPDRNSCKGNRK